jgi:hypothetical protein
MEIEVGVENFPKSEAQQMLRLPHLIFLTSPKRIQHVVSQGMEESFPKNLVLAQGLPFGRISL